MASHSVSWVPSAHGRFENLDLIVMTEGELAQVLTAVQPLHSAGLDAIAESLSCSCTHRRPTPPGAPSSSASITGG